ncbi:MAG: serine protease [Sutterellaceae bacterium]|nr:serine protease [Burkholderiaceae bacterium]MDW8429582.1 serine protease [Sutterellaceae bacterium]
MLAVAALPARAQSARATIERVRAAVVAVGTLQRTRTPPFRFLGSGFAVADGRLIATNAHVLPPALAAGNELERLAVLVPSGDLGSARVLEAVQAAIDEDHDLALLRINSTLPTLALAATDAAAEGDQLLFTGFPLGTVLGPFPVTHRAMIAAITPIAIPPPTGSGLDPKTVRRLQKGAFAVFQLDATAYPGHSGSPLYDPASGEVVGIVNMVFVKGAKESALSQPSGISYAIPVRHLRELLARAR